MSGSIDLSPTNTNQDPTSNCTQFPGGCYVPQKSKLHEERIQALRLNQQITSHTVNPPRWNNSFTFENPIFGVICICLIILYILSVYFRLIEMTGWNIFGGVFLLILYFYDCANNGVSSYMMNKMTPEQFYKYIDEVKQKQLKIIYKVKAYHNQKSYSNSGSKGTNENVKKVITFSQNFELPITLQEDSTQSVTEILSKWKQIRVHSFINYSYGNEESQKCLEDYRWYAEIKASMKDIQYEAEEIVEKPAIIENILVIDPSQKPNPIFSRFAYSFYCIIGLSLLYRVFINKRIPYLQHCLHKKVFSDQIHCQQKYDANDDVQSILRQNNNTNQQQEKQKKSNGDNQQQQTEFKEGEKLKQN